MWTSRAGNARASWLTRAAAVSTLPGPAPLPGGWRRASTGSPISREQNGSQTKMAAVTKQLP